MELPGWLVVSIVASVVLTLLANAIPRWRPGGGRPLDDGLRDVLDRTDPPPPPGVAEGRDDGRDGSRVRIIVPWRLMIAVSLGLTAGLNLLAALTR